MSPYDNVPPGLPPTLISLEDSDKTVSYRQIELLTAAMIEAGRRYELAGYPQ